MASFQAIGHHQFSAEDRVFFDTNIWISLFNCRSAPDKQETSQYVKIYNGAFARAQKANSQFFTHPFVVSEFINRMVRDEHHFQVGLGEADRNFKVWASHCGISELCCAIVADSTRQFLNICQLAERPFSKTALEKCLLSWEEDSRDLNDEFLREICAGHDLKLVTHDGDFAHCELEILTANATYLR